MYFTEAVKRKFKNDRFGNVVFWLSFCIIGQPLVLIIYYHDWRKNQGLLP